MAVPRTASRGTLATVSGVVLTGGASQRMGSDKAHLEFDGRPAAEHIARLLAGLVNDVLIVGGSPPDAALVAGARLVADVDGPQCSLRGLVSALVAARTDCVLVVATDLPFVTPDLLLALVAWPEADAVVPRDANGRHALCALYRREPVLAVARERLERGQLALGGLLGAIDTAYVEGEALERVDPEGAALTNVNTPDELAAARERQARCSPMPGDPA
jgi:molybdopterin-guanine dinucleotide biosynthesis protein A